MTETSKHEIKCEGKCQHNNECYYDNFIYLDQHIEKHSEPHRCKAICLEEHFQMKSQTGVI